MNALDKLKDAWQSQSCKSVDIDVNKMEANLRLHKRAYLISDLIVILTLSGVGTYFSVSGFSNLQTNWPWLIATFCIAFVAILMASRLWSTRQKSSNRDQSIAHFLEVSIAEERRQIKLQQSIFWWYILPLALACMIPTFLLSAQRPDPFALANLLAMLAIEFIFVVIFLLVYLFIRFIGRWAHEARLKELSELRSRLVTDVEDQVSDSE